MTDRPDGHTNPPIDEYTGDGEAAADAAAAAVAAHLNERTNPLRETMQRAAAEYDALLRSVRQLGPTYAFDRAGRPAAIDAVRQALPAVERDLFEAILDDYVCERAAIEEALLRVALAYGQRMRAEAG